MTTIGKLLVNEALPEEYRDENRVFGKDEADAMLGDLARRDPEKFRDVSYKLMTLGRIAAFEEGTTLRLSDTIGPVDKTEILKFVKDQEQAIKADKTMSVDEKRDTLEEVYNTANETLKSMTYDMALAQDNPFAMQVKSKARGSTTALAALLTSPGTYQDAKDRIVPLFIGRSYAEGLKPHEYWAATYGARKGVVSSKFSTRNAGYLGKLLGMSVLDSVVTEPDCETSYGIPVKADDRDNVGTVLARDTGGFTAGTVVTADIMAALGKKKIDEIVVRSPMTCSSDTGVCQQCTGIRESGDFPEIGYHIGANAASAMAEQVAQGSLNVKHTGKKESGHTTYSGFNVIKNLATIPSTYPDKATVSELDGSVDRIESAPQGGNYIYINETKHYIPQEMPITVKEGDVVEAGDALSDGVINPADVVRLKGLGEGRRYFADRLTEAYRDSRYGINRRNTEVLARSIVNHIKVDDEGAEGDSLPGDILTYSRWQKHYKPRKDAMSLPVKEAIGQYLEEPVLHYSIGTRVTKNVADRLKRFGTESVLSHKQQVGVSPSMLSVVNTPEHTGDWMARLGTSYLKTRLLKDVQSGATSNIHGVHPIPAIAKGVELGDQKGDTFTF